MGRACSFINDVFLLFLQSQNIFPYLCPLMENEKSNQINIH